MILYLVRHGQSTWNLQRRVQGQAIEPPLTELGRAQAAEAARRLAHVRLDAVLSSDQVRARQSAEPIAAAHGLPVTVTALLREQDLGELEGKRYEELTAQPVPDGAHISEVRWGHGESLADVAVRMRELVDWLRASYPEQSSLALVGHGDSLRVLDAVLAGRSHRDVDFEAGSTWGNGTLVERNLA